MSGAFTTAATVDDALTALAAGARPVAGGTDLVVGARQGKAPLPESLVAIHRLGALGKIEETGAGLRIGALVTHAEIVAHPLVRDRLTALADASAIVGSHATRAQGTIGGNLMNASPAMETGGPLMCLDATVTLRSATGSRSLAVGELCTGPGSTVAVPAELLVAVEVPNVAPGTDHLRNRVRDRARGRHAGWLPDALRALGPRVRRVGLDPVDLDRGRVRRGDELVVEQVWVSLPAELVELGALRQGLSDAHHDASIDLPVRSNAV
ncbi:MAG TPA: FAD binding domain-containing protein, partial [Gaiella sp.]|nr:FAD binding domain-containing protein [Gaiella sp.]